jgi:uncharacterized lipoprotein YajG
VRHFSSDWRTEGIKAPEGDKLSSEIRIVYMKKYICLLAGVALLAACEQKETTVTNPPAEKKETNTTVINPSPATTTKQEKTEVNINTSPSP